MKMLEIGRRISNMVWRSISLETSSQSAVVERIVVGSEFSNMRLSPATSSEK
jgi:hypothetical protein